MKEFTKCANIPSFFYLLPSCPAGTSLLWKSDSNHSAKIYLKISRNLLRDLHFYEARVKNFNVWRETQGIKIYGLREGFNKLIVKTTTLPQLLVSRLRTWINIGPAQICIWTLWGGREQTIGSWLDADLEY